MAQFTVRNLEDEVKRQLQGRARRHGASLEEEVRGILRNAVRDSGKAKLGLGTRMAARFARSRITADLPELRGETVKPAEFGV